MASILTMSVFPTYIVLLMLWTQVHHSKGRTAEGGKKILDALCDDEDNLRNETLRCVNAVPKNLTNLFLKCIEKIGDFNFETTEMMLEAFCGIKNKKYDIDPTIRSSLKGNRELTIEIRSCLKGKRELMMEEALKLTPEDIKAIIHACETYKDRLPGFLHEN